MKRRKRDDSILYKRYAKVNLPRDTVVQRFEIGRSTEKMNSKLKDFNGLFYVLIALLILSLLYFL